MTAQDRVLQLVRMKGPLLPSSINKELNTNVLFASAMLSELVDRKQLRLTALKIGGSPLYYVPGQESRLQQYAKHLPEKEYRTYELLRDKRILLDRDQTPLVRATLREIKDYAVPLDVNTPYSTELFWKWYLSTNEEAEKHIKKYYDELERGQQPASQLSPGKAPLGLMQPEEHQQQRMLQPQQQPREQQRQQSPALGAIEKEKDKRDKAGMSSQQELPEAIERSKSAGAMADITKASIVKKQGIDAAERQHQEQKEHEKSQEEESGIPDNFSDKAAPKDKFLKKIQQFCTKNEIIILDYKIIRRESDLELSVLIPSNVGKLQYFCKAKNKQKCSDGDVSSAYVQSQSRKLPVLFLTSGEVTKKAEALARQEFRTMVIKKI